jgi:hypothetical protein
MSPLQPAGGGGAVATKYSSRRSRRARPPRRVRGLKAPGRLGPGPSEPLKAWGAQLRLPARIVLQCSTSCPTKFGTADALNKGKANRRESFRQTVFSLTWSHLAPHRRGFSCGQAELPRHPLQPLPKSADKPPRWSAERRASRVMGRAAPHQRGTTRNRLACRRSARPSLGRARSDKDKPGRRPAPRERRRLLFDIVS